MMEIKRIYEIIHEYRNLISLIIHFYGCSEGIEARHQALNEVLNIIEEEYPGILKGDGQDEMEVRVPPNALKKSFTGFLHFEQWRLIDGRTNKVIGMFDIGDEVIITTNIPIDVRVVGIRFTRDGVYIDADGHGNPMHFDIRYIKEIERVNNGNYHILKGKFDIPDSGLN